jgi:hypothetical protein
MKIRTLLLYSSGGTSRDIFLQTYLGPLLKKIQGSKLLTNGIKNEQYQRLLYSLISPYEALSYINDWKEAFENSDELDVTSLNILNQRHAHSYLQKHIKEFDLIILMHSVLGDNVEIIIPFEQVLKERTGKLLSFVGNEYDLMLKKKAFLQNVDADYIASQLPHEAHTFVYKELSAQLIDAPHALNENIYRPSKSNKVYDIAFSGAKYGIFIGDQERNNLIETMANLTPQLKNKINIGRNTNLPRNLWVELLQSAKATVGAEAGTYYLDRNGSLLEQSKEYVQQNPDANLDDLLEKIFDNTSIEYVSGKAISSRHFEPVGTKTCQILLEGNFNGILKEGEHYISVKKNFSNLKDVIDVYSDHDLRNQIIERAYAYISENHTYKNRVETITNKLFNI